MKKSLTKYKKDLIKKMEKPTRSIFVTFGIPKSNGLFYAVRLLNLGN